MLVNHLKLNLDKTELLFLLGKACPLKDLSITVLRVQRTLDSRWTTPCHSGQLQSSDSLLQVHALQHLYSTTLPHTGSGAGPNPGTCHLRSGLLQLAVGWAPCLCHQISATNPVYCSPPGCQFSTVVNSPMLPRSSGYSTRFQSKFASTTRPWGLPTEQQEELPRPYLQAMLKPYTPTQALRSAISGPLALQPQLPLSPVQALLCSDTLVEPASP
jgi:hypothetical protein